MVYSSFKDNVWGADLADLQLVSKCNKEIRFLLCVIDLFSKDAWAVPLKGKKGTTIVNAFQHVLNDSKRKPNKIWVDQGNEFYNNSFKKWLKDNSLEMYSTYNEGKSVIGERFIRTLKSKIYKHMTAVSKNVYFDVLLLINTIIHTKKTIKMKAIGVKSNSYAEYNVNSNVKDLRFKIGDHVRISKYKDIFPKWSEEVFVVSKIKNTVPWTYVIDDLNGEEFMELFMK